MKLTALEKHQYQGYAAKMLASYDLRCPDADATVPFSWTEKLDGSLAYMKAELAAQRLRDAVAAKGGAIGEDALPRLDWYDDRVTVTIDVKVPPAPMYNLSLPHLHTPKGVEAAMRAELEAAGR